MSLSKKILSVPLIVFLLKFTFTFFEKISGYYLERRRFKKRTGYELDIKNPETFNEKIVHKKIFDRNPLLPITADKYLVRNYVKEKIGEKHLIPILYVTSDPETIPFDELGCDYVIKANHASGKNIIITNETLFERSALIAKMKSWLSEPYGFFKHEWAYQEIPRKIVVEKLLKEKNKNLELKDYKFHMFNGSCEVIQVNHGHFADKENRELTLFNTKWERFSVFWEFPSSKEDIQKPHKLKDMLEIAEKLSEGFDYVRIDLYLVENDIFFGEMTHYPTSGSARVKPKQFDEWMGALWS